MRNLSAIQVRMFTATPDIPVNADTITLAYAGSKFNALSVIKVTYIAYTILYGYFGTVSSKKNRQIPQLHVYTTFKKQQLSIYLG